LSFLKFLNKGKAKAKEELDIPPMPPPPADFSEGSEPVGDELPQLPEINEKPEEEITPVHGLGDELPSLPEEPVESAPPELGPIEEEPAGSVVEEEIPIVPLTKPEIERPIKREKAKQVKPLFVNMDSFKNIILKNISLMKGELTTSNQILSKLSKLEQDETALFKDWQGKMEDLQKKLMSIDKILFKG